MSIAIFATITRFGINSQCIESVCYFVILGTCAASVPSFSVISCMTFIVMLNIAFCFVFFIVT